MYTNYTGTFAQQLKNNTTLRRLNLSKCGLTTPSIKSLAEALTTNEHFEDLDISDNALCNDDIQHLAQALRVNKGLKTLYLKSCNLTSQSAESLGKALTTNEHLKVLNISGNPLRDDGIQHIAKALKDNLTELYLDSCGITNIGLEYLANSIQHNNGLNTLSITNSEVPLDERDKRSDCYTSISEKIVPVLKKCLQDNKTLTNLELSCTLKTSVTVIEGAVNGVRKQRRLPLLRVNLNLDEND